MLILEYFYVVCIPQIFLKHLDWGEMSVLVWVNLSTMYSQKEILKTSYKLGGQ